MTAIEVTLFNITLMALDGIECNTMADTIFPIPLSLHLCVELIWREVKCFYSTINLFAAYSSLIRSTQSMKIVYSGTSLLLSDELFRYENNQGCYSIIPTDATPTKEPDNRTGMYWLWLVGDTVMNIIASFFLFLVLVFLIVKCILNCYEDKRILNEMQSGHLRSNGQQSIEMNEIH